MKKKIEEKILVVDDEPVIRSFLEEALNRRGYIVESCENARKAVDRLTKEKYPLLIVDIKMPGESGLWLLKEVKKRQPDTEVIITTASDDLSDAITSLNLGASRYLLKPFEVEELVHTVRELALKRKLILENREYQKNLEDKVRAQTEELRKLFVGAMRALATVLEAKDSFTKGHSDKVARMAISFARILSLKRKEIEDLKIAAFLHDIGKVGVREAILQKTGPLSKEEFSQIKSHPLLSERIVRPVVEKENILKAIRNHHERYDGNGYPDGLKGEEIPLFARILTVADAYEAMTSNRPYRKAFPTYEADRRLKEGEGTQFDPEIVKAFFIWKLSQKEG